MTDPVLLQVSVFLHPAFAWAALAGGLIPVAIHLLNRRRHVRLPWAAMSFLFTATRRSRKRVWLEQLLLMFVRVAVIVLFGLAVARPFLPASALVPARNARVHRILVIDDSLSMNAKAADGSTRFARGKQTALRLLDAFPQHDSISLVTASDPATAVIADPNADRRFARESLARLSPTQGSTDFVGALTITRRLLDESPFPPANRTVYVISDFAVNDWRSGPRDGASPAVRALRDTADELASPATDLVLIQPIRDEGENIAITRLETTGLPPSPARPAELSLEVTNLGSTATDEVTLSVRMDGHVIRRERIPSLEPGTSTVRSVTAHFATAGTHFVEASVASTARDVLAADDARGLSVEVRESIPVLLVDGRPGRSPLSGQAGYLATALAPRLSDDGPMLFEPVVVSESELPGQDLSRYDVVALCNVRRLTGTDWQRLERLTRGGGGLFVFLGDRVDSEDYNRHAAGSAAGLLPCTMDRAPRTPGDPDTGWHFKYAALEHPIVRDFVGHPDSGLFTARVTSYLPITLDADRGDVVLRLTNDDPAFIASQVGRGHVLVVATTANMDWTNLPAKGDFISLVSNAMAYLTPPRGQHRNLRVGDTIREPLTAAESSMPLRVRLPEKHNAEPAAFRASRIGGDATRERSGQDGSRLESVEPRLAADDDGLSLVHGPVDRAGRFDVMIADQSRIFAVNVDPAESQLMPVMRHALLNALDRPARWIGDGDGDGEGTLRTDVGPRSAELAAPMLYVLVVLLLVEGWMAMRFGSRRPRALERGADAAPKT